MIKRYNKIQINNIVNKSTPIFLIKKTKINLISNGISLRVIKNNSSLKYNNKKIPKLKPIKISKYLILIKFNHLEMWKKINMKLKKTKKQNWLNSTIQWKLQEVTRKKRKIWYSKIKKLYNKLINLLQWYLILKTMELNLYWLKNKYLKIWLK